MKKFYKIITPIFLAALSIGLVFYFEDNIKSTKENLDKIINPCDKPIEYSVGNFDQRFGLKREDLLRAISQAEQIWEKSINKELFGYADAGVLKINLIYDSRQEATDKLKELGFTIHSDQATYEFLKSKYSSLKESYDRQKNELDNMVNYYNQQKADYEDEIKAANKRGGVNPEEYAILEQERKDLNILAEAIKNKQISINKIIDDINAMVNVINRLIRELNLNVNNYNNIGASSAGEFQEGQYVKDQSGERIDIFQFDDYDSLVRVLAHELGHAIGIEHLDNPEAIMYRLNEKGKEKITADDVEALKAVCQIK